MRSLLLLLAIGCHTEQVCVSTPEPIGDDDPTDLGITAADVFAHAGGLYVTTGRYDDDTETPVEIDVTRGEGTAEFLRAAWDERRVPGLQFARESALLICSAAIHVPVQLAVHTPDDVVALDAPAVLASLDPMFAAEGNEAYIQIDGPPDALGGVTPPDDLVPESGFAQVWFGGGEMLRGSIGYGGTSEDGASGWAHYVLTW